MAKSALAADLLGDLLDDEIHHVASRGPGHRVRRDAGSRLQLVTVHRGQHDGDTLEPGLELVQGWE